jgi:hypothetical protein
MQLGPGLARGPTGPDKASRGDKCWDMADRDAPGSGYFNGLAEKLGSLLLRRYPSGIVLCGKSVVESKGDTSRPEDDGSAAPKTRGTGG